MTTSPRRALGRVRLWAVLLLLVIGAAGVVATIAWQHYRRFTDAPLSIPAARTVEFARGTSFKDIVRQLRRDGVTHGSPLYWRLL
jgi:UPF0755 protein